MKRLSKILLIAVLVLGAEALAQARSADLPILPTPKEWHWQEGKLQLHPSLPIRASSQLEAEAKILEQVISDESGLKLEILPFEPADLKKAGLIIAFADENAELKAWLEKQNLSFSPAMEEEGYILWIDNERCLLTAKTKKGIFYGIQSLRFLLRSEASKNQIPGIVVRDWPDFQMRGITDDISRGQVSTIENFKTIISFLAEYKMNVYMPYLEDMFQFQSFPTIGLNRGALSPKECLELQDFADRFHIEIIPIFQTLGHYENILLQPEFRHLAEFPGAASLNVSSGEIYGFLEKVLAEIVPVFRSIYFHMGADESWDVGSGTSRPRSERYGVATVHAEHYRRVIEILRHHQKQVMIYSDIVLENPTILNEIPQDVIFFDWHYWPQDFYGSAEVFKKSGRQFIISPGIHNWARIFPYHTDALANIRQLTSDGKNKGAIGAITSNWGDYGGANLRELNYYSHAWAADCAWNVEAANLISFEKNFFRNFYGTSDPGLANVYHLLNKFGQQITWPLFFGHPFYPLGENLIDLIRRATELDLSGQEIVEEIGQLKGIVKDHADHLDYLSFCADIFAWYGRLGQIQLDLHKISKYELDSKVKESLAPKYGEKLSQLREELNNLKDTYQKLWLRTNRPENLQRILALLDRLSQYLSIKAEEIKGGDFSFNGKMEAPFISHPRAKESKAGAPLIFLRKRFYLDKPPEKAWLQAISDSHARIWVNGKEIGEVLARKSLSAWVESERVKAWEVSSYLKKGENILSLMVQNYIPQSSALANIWLEAHIEGVWQKLISSDRYWKTSDQKERGWELPGFNDQDWLPAVEVENKWLISRPYFGRGLPSRIEFYQ